MIALDRQILPLSLEILLHLFDGRVDLFRADRQLLASEEHHQEPGVHQSLDPTGVQFLAVFFLGKLIMAKKADQISPRDLFGQVSVNDGCEHIVLTRNFSADAAGRPGCWRASRRRGWFGLCLLAARDGEAQEAHG